MSRLYFSGIEKRSIASVLVEAGAAGMMSQLSYSENLLAACKDIPLVMDSGAYSMELTHRDIEKYAALINRLADRCIWYANADTMGNQEKSNENYAFLLSLLPEALHDRILWIYQCSSDLRYLYERLAKYNRIGIGGLVPLILSDKERARSVILHLAGIIRQYNCVPHYFGLSTFSILEALHSYGEYTVDSTTWLIGTKYGLLVNNEGRQRPSREGGYDFSTQAILEQNVRTMRRVVECPIENTKLSPFVQMSLFDERIA